MIQIVKTECIASNLLAISLSLGKRDKDKSKMRILLLWV